MEDSLELILTTKTAAADSADTLIKPPKTFTTIIILIAISYTIRRLLHLFYNRHRIPILTFKPAAAAKPLFCTVCLNDVAAGDRYRKLPKCNHSFHVDCIDAWFQSNSTCPLCRNQIPDEQLPPRPAKNNANPTFLSSFITISKNVIKNIGNPLCHDLRLALCENLWYGS